MIVKIFYVILILVFLITGCAAPSLQPAKDEIPNGIGDQLADEDRKVDYTIVDEQIFNPETGELLVELVEPRTLLLGLPHNAILKGLFLEKGRLLVSLDYQETEWTGMNRVQLELERPLGGWDGVDYRHVSGKELQVGFSQEEALQAAREILEVDFSPSFYTTCILRADDPVRPLEIGYYYDFSDGEEMNRRGNATVRGWVAVSAVDGSIIYQELGFTYFPGGQRLHGDKPWLQMEEAPVGLQYGSRRLVPEETESEFGPVLLSLGAVDEGGRSRVIWDEEGLFLDSCSMESLGKVSWSPDGKRTYFSTEFPGPSYGNWYTRGRIWEYDWTLERISLVSYLPDKSFFLPREAEHIYFGDFMFPLKDIVDEMKVNIRPASTASLFHTASPYNIFPWFAAVDYRQELQVFQENGEWVYVQQDGKRGWLPTWYIQEAGNENIQEMKPVSLVFKEDARGYLYPEDSAPVVLELEQGRVVRARKTYNGWIMAEITVYDIPGPFGAWFPPSALVEPGPTAEPQEGLVKKGKTVYAVWGFEEINEARGEMLTHDTVFVTGERRDGMVQIRGVAGWNGWVRENDLILDPWLNKPLPEL